MSLLEKIDDACQIAFARKGKNEQAVWNDGTECQCWLERKMTIRC